MKKQTNTITENSPRSILNEPPLRFMNISSPSQSAAAASCETRQNVNRFKLADHSLVGFVKINSALRHFGELCLLHESGTEYA